MVGRDFVPVSQLVRGSADTGGASSTNKGRRDTRSGSGAAASRKDEIPLAFDFGNSNHAGIAMTPADGCKNFIEYTRTRGGMVNEPIKCSADMWYDHMKDAFYPVSSNASYNAVRYDFNNPDAEARKASVKITKVKQLLGLDADEVKAKVDQDLELKQYIKKVSTDNGHVVIQLPGSQEVRIYLSRTGIEGCPLVLMSTLHLLFVCIQDIRRWVSPLFLAALSAKRIIKRTLEACAYVNKKYGDLKQCKFTATLSAPATAPQAYKLDLKQVFCLCGFEWKSLHIMPEPKSPLLLAEVMGRRRDVKHENILTRDVVGGTTDFAAVVEKLIR